MDREPYEELLEVAVALAQSVARLDVPGAKWDVVPGRVLNMIDDIRRIADGREPWGDWKRTTSTSHEFHLVGTIEGCKHCKRMKHMLAADGQLHIDCPARHPSGTDAAAPVPEKVTAADLLGDLGSTFPWDEIDRRIEAALAPIRPPAGWVRMDNFVHLSSDATMSCVGGEYSIWPSYRPGAPFTQVASGRTPAEAAQAYDRYLKTQEPK